MTSVGEFCPFIYGKGLPRTKRSSGKFGVYSSAGLIGSHSEPYTKTAGIVIGRKGTVGSVHLSKEPFWPIDTAFFVLDEPRKRDLLFTFYRLSTLGLSHMNSDSAVPGLNRENAHAIEFLAPPLAEQREISSILGALDDKIDLNRRMAATLEEMARALYRSWFVDFDPVKAKAEGLAPAFMDEATAALFPDRFGDDGLPYGWGMMPLSSLCVQVKDSIDPRKNTDRVFDHYSLPAFDAGKGPVREPGSAIQSQKLRIPTEAILFSRLNPTTPRIWWARTSDQVFASVASTEFLVTVARIEEDMPFLYSLLVSDGFRGNVVARVTGTSNSHQRVKPASVLDIEVVGATDEIRGAFGAMTAPWFDRIDELSHENRTLTALRDTLLPKLMSGELRVGEAKDQIEEVA